MSWRSRGGGETVSKRWTFLLCLGSFFTGLLFTNRMWTMLEVKESDIIRTNRASVPNKELRCSNGKVATRSTKQQSGTYSPLFFRRRFSKKNSEKEEEKIATEKAVESPESTDHDDLIISFHHLQTLLNWSFVWI
ncbi:uncharacterized protein LOC141846611 [Curcuma longa]|uniref:uncharacterized protein LOC141846611 n=1 Tax=Curcuma longa TaxID=136217 RepID=UPI003D9F5D87